MSFIFSFADFIFVFKYDSSYQYTFLIRNISYITHIFQNKTVKVSLYHKRCCFRSKQ